MKDKKESFLTEYDKEAGFSKCKAVVHKNGNIELIVLEENQRSFSCISK